ncbi:NnrS family protein [Cocleimonas flava]|uniref:Uncharacterized protein involved in response to NO n=1 Tax=Cocleimonas flava TaxID=634765 RepID=A0A4R1ESI8_9GAMM|nr:NnrS family protein [Cocleimonas flava]TCJ84526.1 uncharacterized protein involved in response to NO [Cocleimonas flava]
MQVLNLSTPSNPPRFSFFDLGFRAFFLGAAAYAVLSILIWFFVYSMGYQMPQSSITTMQWHAHEMIYGYSIAVIAGFLLTATKNWTGIQTLNGKPLLALACVWVAARITLFFGQIVAAAVLDLLFTLWLSQSIVAPIIKAKQWSQLAIVIKLLLLFVTNALFYLGAMGILAQGVNWGIYGGLYLVIGLILMMARRVVPFFIERGVDETVTLKNVKFLDLSSLALFLIFMVLELGNLSPQFSAYSAILLFIVNAIRLVNWHTPGIWKKPLLWSLYLAIWFICVGFLLFGLSYFLGISKFIAIHALSYAGIGAITLGMMSRVGLGHSGRDVSNPPKAVGIALGILILGAIVRVFFPLIDASHYLLWISISQGLWILAFVTFFITYLPLLTKAKT